MAGTAPFSTVAALLRQRSQASARIRGSGEYPRLSGTVHFYQTKVGVLVAAGITGLPASQDPCEERIFAFHIHSGTQCRGEEGDPFARALSHYNPDDCAHPHHAGDLPPLFGNRGRAFQAFLTDRFSVREVIGRTVILHAGPDDFTSQPSGNAGAKIACGLIEAVKGC